MRRQNTSCPMVATQTLAQKNEGQQGRPQDCAAKTPRLRATAT